MDREGAIEEDAAERARPIFMNAVEHPIHDLDRHQAEAVVDEMGRHVGEHDESRTQPEPPDHTVHLPSLPDPNIVHLTGRNNDNTRAASGVLSPLVPCPPGDGIQRRCATCPTGYTTSIEYRRTGCQSG